MKKYIILIILFVILGLGIFVGFNVLDDKETTVKTIFNKKTYDEYKVGDLVRFNDEEWYVMYDSLKNSDYVTLISSNIISLEEENITTVVGGIYETSELNKYLKNDLAKSLGEENLVEKNGYKIRLLSEDDFESLVTAEYNKEKDEYEITDCPDFICLTNCFYATMIDTENNLDLTDVYYNVDDIEDVLYDDYVLHLKYYNLSSTYETYKLNSLVDNATLFVRPVINVYKSSLDK